MATCVGDLNRHEEAQDQAYINWLGINPRFQGRGLGRLTFERMERELFDLGYRHIVLGTQVDNVRGQLLYLNSGYRVINQEYRYVSGIDGSG